MKVAVLILSFNEADNLPACLDALSWCDNIVVVDSGSTDGTVEIARSRGAEVLQRPFDTFAAQRNFGLEQGLYHRDWILHLDSDEVVTGRFVERLDALEPSDGIDAYRVPSKTMLFGRWIRRSSMYPVYQVRLGHRERLRFKQVGHAQHEDLPLERVGLFDEPYLHFSYSKGLKHWFEKHIRYARDEAELLLSQRGAGKFRLRGLVSSNGMERRRAFKALTVWIPVMWRPLLRFLHVYVLRFGFLDGRGGIAYALMMSVYEGMIASFVLETQFGGQQATVLDRSGKP